MSHRDGRVTLSAWVDPVVRDHARFAAKSAGVEFSRWIERAVQWAVAAESTACALRDAEARQHAVEKMKRSATAIPRDALVSALRERAKYIEDSIQVRWPAEVKHNYRGAADELRNRADEIERGEWPKPKEGT